MFGFFKKFKYETIAIRHYTINWHDDDGNSVDSEKITYVFKANGFDKRKVNIHAYGKVKSRGFDKNNDMYHTIVLPWVENSPELDENEDEDEPELDPKPKVKKKGNVITLDIKRKSK